MSVSNEISARPWVGKPTSARCDSARLRNSSPATTSSTAVNATCVTTRTSRKANRRAPTRPAGASPRRSATRLGDEAFNAGSRLARTPLIPGAATANASTRQSMPRSSEISTGSGNSMASSERITIHAHAIDAAAPSSPSTRPSTSSWRTSRERLAPIARRTPISRRRAEARASSMPATFAQAMRSTRPTTDISPAAPIDMMPLACGTSSRTSVVGTADIRRSLFVCGFASASWRPMSETFACACSAVTPGFSRPFTNIQRMPRRSSCVRPGPGTTSVMPNGSTSSMCAIGSHSSGATSGTTPRKSGRVTPTMV